MNNKKEAKTTTADVGRVLRNRLKTIQKELDTIKQRYQEDTAGLQAEKTRLNTMLSEFSTKRKSSRSSGRLLFRANSRMKRAYALLKQSPKALTTVEILEGIGETVTPNNRASLASDLYRAVKRSNEIKVISPGMFALHELEIDNKPELEPNIDEIPEPEAPEINLPDNFGKDEF